MGKCLPAVTLNEFFIETFYMNTCIRCNRIRLHPDDMKAWINRPRVARKECRNAPSRRHNDIKTSVESQVFQLLLQPWHLLRIPKIRRTLCFHHQRRRYQSKFMLLHRRIFPRVILSKLPSMVIPIVHLQPKWYVSVVGLNWKSCIRNSLFLLSFFNRFSPLVA